MRKAIFVRMPRCGSTSLVDFCSKNKNIEFYGGKDMGFWGDSGSNISSCLVRCIEDYVGKKAYEESFTFSSVRNPYARAVSMFNHGTWKSANTFNDFCNALKNGEYPSKAAKWHSSTLVEHIASGGDLEVDFVIRLEKFQEGFNEVCDRIGLARSEVPHSNRSKHGHYTEYYDEKTIEIISSVYAKDIEYFGYNFGE